MAETFLVYAPRAQRDLLDLPRRFSEQILEDLGGLAHSAWSSQKVKKLKGYPYWEVKTGDYRSLFLREGKRLVILRVVNRRNLAREIRRIDLRDLAHWLTHP